MGQVPRLSNADIDRALAGGELYCHFQPRVSLASGEVLGAEALARWQHKDLGDLPPSVFLAAFQRQGRTQELTQFVINTALRACSTWHDAGRNFPVHVNLCADDLHFPGLAQTLEISLRKYDLTPRCVRLELKEEDYTNLSREARMRLRALLALGCTLAVQGPSDDHLRDVDELHFHEYQIRGGALLSLAEVLTPTRSGRLLGLIRAAKALNRETTAVGVETPAHVQTAIALGFDAAIGFAVAKPMALSSLLGWRPAREVDQVRDMGFTSSA